MAVTLRIDQTQWRAAADDVATQLGGIVPVVKGNGYGFTAPVLLAEATRLGADTVAVGTYAELPTALGEFAGTVLVMEPYRAAIHSAVAGLTDPRTLHTVTTIADHEDLAARGAHRVLVEGRTSMNRFGASLEHLGSLAARPGVEGAALHLPLGRGHVEEISRWVGAHAGVRTWFVSHVDAAELGTLRARFPDRDLRPRVGTALWLTGAQSYRVEADVLDVFEVKGAQRVGYRGREVRGGHVVVVSGGTSHGVAMESPKAADGVRGRAIALAEGALEAAHRVRSPFIINGAHPLFVEPPHMQCSLLHLPSGQPAPVVGDRVPVRLRLTVAHVDTVAFDTP